MDDSTLSLAQSVPAFRATKLDVYTWQLTGVDKKGHMETAMYAARKTEETCIEQRHWLQDAHYGLPVVLISTLMGTCG